MTTTTWKRGMPPGKYYPGMTLDFEVAFAPLAKWHRRRTQQERLDYAVWTAVCDLRDGRIGPWGLVR